jgi:photosystem II stability/assembly factor-like uncharacterized protein
MRCFSLARAAMAGAVVAIAAAAASSPAALANGRPPATTNVVLPPEDDQTFLVPATFGLLKTVDGGGTFHWVCENAIGYSGTYDPDYAIGADGSIYVTTFDGLKVSRDGGCTWEPVEGISQELYVAEVEVGPDGRVWAATGQHDQPNDVYVSEDGGRFASSGAALENGWWASLRVAQDGKQQRIYVTGLLPDDPATKEKDEEAALLSRSVDGGETWEPLEVTDFEFDDTQQLYLLGVSPMDADIVFARIAGAVEPNGDTVYRSDDGGQNWELVLTFANKISAFHIRPDGQTVIVGTMNACPGEAPPDSKGCVRISRKAGAPDTFVAAKEQPRLACLGERSDGMLFGCGDNWEPDNFALGSSPDGETWTKIYRFSETAGPLSCDSGTEQATCSIELWPPLCETFGICQPQAPDAGPSASDAGGSDGEDDGGGDSGGCCRVGGGSDVTWVPGVLFVLFLFRRRRRAGGR